MINNKTDISGYTYFSWRILLPWMKYEFGCRSEEALTSEDQVTKLLRKKYYIHECVPGNIERASNRIKVKYDVRAQKTHNCVEVSPPSCSAHRKVRKITKGFVHFNRKALYAEDHNKERDAECIQCS